MSPARQRQKHYVAYCILFALALLALTTWLGATAPLVPSVSAAKARLSGVDSNSPRQVAVDRDHDYRPRAAHYTSAGAVLRNAYSLNSQPSLSISDAMVIEGERSDAPAAVFTVTLSPASFTQEVSVDYLMVNDAKVALAAPPAESQRGTLVFAPDETVKMLTIPILFASTEGVESFRVRLFNATNARIADGEGVGSTPVRFDPDRAAAAIVRAQPELAPAGVTALADLLTPSANPQPAILGATSASNRAVVFPDPNTSPTTQNLVPGLPANAAPHGVSYFGSDTALISDFGNSRVFVVQVSTATVLSTINTAPASYDGTGTIAVAPNLGAALAMGGSTSLKVIQGPFNASSTINSVTLPGSIAGYQTQAIVFNNAGRGFVYHTTGISVLDAPYTSVAFTIPVSANSVSGAIAISPDGNTLLTTILSGNQVRIFQAPFSASSTPTLLTVTGGSGLDGIAVTPDGTKAIVVSAFVNQAAAISAPFSSSSTVQTLPLPAGSNGFEDVGISADSQLVIITGNSSTEPPIFIRAPFTAAGAQSFAVPLQNVTNTARGNGAVRFLPPGLAPGLTISKSAPASVPSLSNLTYTISYSNTGTLGATSVVIRDPLPAGTTFVSATNGGTLTGATVVFNIGTVNAGTGAQTVSFTVKVTAASGASVNNNNYAIEANGVTPIPGPPVTTAVTAPQTFSISGRVTDSGNNGISGVTMSLTGSATATTTTDASGNYSFIGLIAGGSYTVTPSKTGLSFTPPSQTFSNLSANQTANFTGTPTVSISGRVTDGSNNGINGVQVTLSGTLTRVVQTDAAGNYSFNNLVGGGNYSVVAASPLFVFNPLRFDFTNLTTNQTANFVQVPNAVPSPTPPLSDDFNAVGRDPQKWNLGTATQPAGAFDPQVTVAQASGQLVITPRANVSGPHYNGYVSVNAFNMTGGRASVELDQAASGGADTIFALGTDADNFFRFVVHTTSGIPSAESDGTERPLDTGATQLIFQVKINGQLQPDPPRSIPYDPVQHKFMRFRHEPPTNSIVFETSPNANFEPISSQNSVVLQKGVSALNAELSAGTTDPTNPGQTKFDNFNLVTSTFQFSLGTYTVGEGDQRVNLTVTRSGDTSGAANVGFATNDAAGLQNCNVINGIASPRCDYTNTGVAVTWAAGDASPKSFSVAIVDDSFAEGNETFTLGLIGASGAALAAPSRATVTIMDNDTVNGPNPIDSTNFFVRQQYIDFLGREPDPPGFAGWVNTINNCTGDTTQCDRIHVSQLFFQSAEFQQRGYFVYRFYPVAFGRKPDYAEFVVDLASVSGFLTDAQLEAAKVAFIAAFMARPAFANTYSSPNTPAGNTAYVDALLNTAAVTLAAATRQTLIDGLNNATLTRAVVLRQIVESNEVSNKYNHQAYAVMEYFGYLRRQPDAFYLDWIRVLDQTNDPRGMVTGFATSIEYRNRFGP